MVNIKIVRNSNNSLQHLPPGLVAVFAGGTAGIGLGTLRAFAKNCNAPKAYIIGRFHEKAIRIIDNLKSINSGGSFVFIEGQVSLIHDVDRMCEEIKKLETHIDILCMSPGYLTFTGNDASTEGIETDLALQYYARQRLVYNLIPLLEKSSSPRVISVLAAGLEGKLDMDDLDRHKNYSVMKATKSAITMTDLMFEEFAKLHPTISFIHSHPGKVGTHIVDRMLGNIPGVLWYPAQIPRYTIVPLYTHLLCTSPDEAGERILFLATSGRYPAAIVHEQRGKIEGFIDRPHTVPSARATIRKDGRGNGVYRTNSACEIWKDNKLLDEYHNQDVSNKVWEHTLGVWEKALKIVDEGVQKQAEESFQDSGSLEFEPPAV